MEQPKIACRVPDLEYAVGRTRWIDMRVDTLFGVVLVNLEVLHENVGGLGLNQGALEMEVYVGGETWGFQNVQIIFCLLREVGRLNTEQHIIFYQGLL